MPNDTETLAFYLASALHTLLPHIMFQIYLPRVVLSGGRAMYVFGFLSRDVLIGGYRMPPPLVEADIELHLLHASLFFHDAWAAELPRFYPESVRDLYEAHRAGGLLLRRLV
jgi:hypothetical protein